MVESHYFEHQKVGGCIISRVNIGSNAIILCDIIVNIGIYS